MREKIWENYHFLAAYNHKREEKNIFNKIVKNVQQSYLILFSGGRANVSHNANSWPHSQFPLHYAPSHYAHFNIFYFILWVLL